MEKKIINPKPYCAIDGTKHNDMYSVSEANSRFWHNILINQNTEKDSTFQITTENKKLINLYFENTAKSITIHHLKYNEWETHYNNFKMGVYLGVFNPDFIYYFSKVLLSAKVLTFTKQELPNYRQQIKDLYSITKSLSLLAQHKR